MFIGLPFAAFIEAFFSLSQRKFPNADNLFDSVNHLVNICTDHLNSTARVPSSPLVPQSDPYFSRRSIRNNNNTINASSLNIRSSTTAPIRRSMVATVPTPILNSHTQPMIPSIRNIDDRTKSSTLKQSTKSVFPLFFDVL